jgi:hypothetical protein
MKDERPVRTFLFDDCEAVERRDDGLRVLIRRDGARHSVEPWAWRESVYAIRAIDAVVPAEKFVESVDRIAEIDRPTEEESPPGDTAILLGACRDVFAAARAGARERLRDYFFLHPNPPGWVTRDPLREVYGRRDELLSKGVVVWGALVQANQLLFRPGTHDAPGEVLYCADANREVDPAELWMIATRLFALKGTVPSDASLVPFADHLTGETGRVFGMALPASLSPVFPASLSSVILNRRYLPSGTLERSVLPLLVLARDPRVSMVLPSKYWPAELLNWWTAGGR